MSILVLLSSVAASGRAISYPPDSLYSHFCTSQTLDSVYVECEKDAALDETECNQACADYYMAEWAYGNSYLQLSEYYIEKALSSKPADKEFVAGCLSRASIIQQRKGNLASALDYAEQCLDIDRESGNLENISSSLNNIAGLYLTFGQFDVAKCYIDEALEIERTLGRDANMALRLGMASEIYLKLDNAECSLKYADEAYRLDSLAGRNARAAIRLCQRASSLSALGQDSLAEKDLLAALPELRKSHNVNSQAIAYAQLGEIYLRSGREKQAGQALDQCVILASSIGNEYIEGRGRKGLWELSRKTSPTAALAHLERYNEIQTRINSDKAAKEMARFNVKYETLKKEQTIALQRQKLNGTLVAIGLLFIILIVLFIAVAFYRKISRLAEEKNAILVREALDRDRLLMLSRQNLERQLKEEINKLPEAVLPAVKLTSRELEIAKLTSQGLLSKEIADKLCISQRTVETHKNNLYRKLGINNNTELVSYMHKAGLA